MEGKEDASAGTGKFFSYTSSSNEVIKGYCRTCQETFQMYKELLEKQQKQLLREPDVVQTFQEVSTFHNMQILQNQLDYTRLVGRKCCENTLNALILIHNVGTRLQSQLNSIAKLNSSTGMKLETDESIDKANFGHVMKAESPSTKDYFVPQIASSGFSSSSFEGDASSIYSGVMTLATDLASKYVELNKCAAKQSIVDKHEKKAERCEPNTSISSGSSLESLASSIYFEAMTADSDLASKDEELNKCATEQCSVDKPEEKAERCEPITSISCGSSLESLASSVYLEAMTADSDLASKDEELNKCATELCSVDKPAEKAERNKSSSQLYVAAAQMNTENTENNLSALSKVESISASNGRDPGLNGRFHSNLNFHATPYLYNPLSSNPVVGVMNSSTPTEKVDLLMSYSTVAPGLTDECPLHGTVIPGTSCLAHGRIQSQAKLSASGSESHDPVPRIMPMRFTFGQWGRGRGQFDSPRGFCLGPEENIIVADRNNHRIQIFGKTGQFIRQFGVAGEEEGRLWYPKRIAFIRSSEKLVICDKGTQSPVTESRMQLFSKTGCFLKKVDIPYIHAVGGLTITSDEIIVVVDSIYPRVFLISEAGDLQHSFDCSTNVRRPSDISAYQQELYICDSIDHSIKVFSEKGHFLRKIGSVNVTNFPNGIDISEAGDVLVGVSHGRRFRLAVFSQQGALVAQFECPDIKVIRCYGLKLTSEGYVITLAKHNHCVLLLSPS